MAPASYSKVHTYDVDELDPECNRGESEVQGGDEILFQLEAPTNYGHYERLVALVRRQKPLNVALAVASALVAALVYFHLAQEMGSQDGQDEASQEHSLWSDNVPDNTVVLPKTTFWSNSRVLFFAGVKETGHELFENALKDVCDGPDIECIRLCVTSTMRWTLAGDFKLHARMQEQILSELVATRKAYEAMRKNEEDNDQDPKRVVYLVNLWGSCKEKTTSFTFPITEHDLDAATSPDLRAHALMAEEAGVDMRFVVLADRNATATVERWFNSYQFSPYVKTNNHILRTVQMGYERMWLQLKLMDRTFFRAFDTTELPGGGAKMVPLEKFDDDYDSDFDRWTGMPGLESALQQHRHDSRKPWVYNEKRPFGGRHWSKAALALMPRVDLAQNSLVEFIEEGQNAIAVEKNVKSTLEEPRPRILFFAGLEGTGHHLFTQVFEKLSKHRDDFGPHCEIQATLYKGRTQRSMGECQKSTLCVQARQKLQAQLNQLGKDPSAAGKTYLVNLMDRGNTGCHDLVGEMSYPNYGGTYKSYQMPDLVTLAQAAERADVDLQVVVLTRPADDIMVSVTVHRHFGAKRELRNLEVASAALSEQLNLIDPNFVAACVDFKDKELKFVAALETALRLPLREEVEKIFRSGGKGGHKNARDKYKIVRQRRIHTLNATTFDIEHNFCRL